MHDERAGRRSLRRRKTGHRASARTFLACLSANIATGACHHASGLQPPSLRRRSHGIFLLLLYVAEPQLEQKKKPKPRSFVNYSTVSRGGARIQIRIQSARAKFPPKREHVRKADDQASSRTLKIQHLRGLRHRRKEKANDATRALR